MALNGNSANVKFTASKESAAKEVEHGLGAEPKSVVCTLNAGQVSSIEVTAKSATKFTVKAFLSEAFSGEVQFYWIATT